MSFTESYIILVYSPGLKIFHHIYFKALVVSIILLDLCSGNSCQRILNNIENVTNASVYIETLFFFT